MNRLRSFLALLLLALWLPVTQHCNLEAAGLITNHCLDNCVPGQADTDDACSTVEGAGYKAPSDFVTAPAPILFGGLDLVSLVVWSPGVAAEFPGLKVEPPDRPLDWVTTWHFVRRAAPPCRAPSFVGA